MTPAGDDHPGPEEGPGARLRREREQRGLTSQQVAEQLNLDAAVIVALEQDDFPSLGAPVFARGHLRRYATLLGIPEQQLLAQYERARQPPVPTLIPSAHVGRLPERHAVRWPWIAGGVAAFVLAGGVVGYLNEYGLSLPWGRDEAADLATASQPGTAATAIDSAAGSSPAASSTTVARQPSAASAVQTGGSVPAVGPGTVTAPAGAAGTPAATSGTLQLDFRFAQDSWVEIFDGTGRAVLYDLGSAGSTRTLTAVAPLSVMIGNAPAVELAINGRPARLPSPGSGQTVIRFRIDASGALH